MEERFERFGQWCDNIDGDLEMDGSSRSTCYLPDDGGRVVLDDRELKVYDESEGSEIDIRTGGTVVQQERGPFRHDRQAPPREGIQSVNERDYHGRVDKPRVNRRKLEVGVEEDSMVVGVFDTSPRAELEAYYGDKSETEIQRVLQSMSEDDPEAAREMKRDLRDAGLL